MRITPQAAAIILGVLALLGVLAFLKVPGAPVAAVGAVGTIIAWLTQPPKKDGSGSLSLSPPKVDDPSEAPTIPPPPPAPKL
jgi:small-conductance mechanosensitive channel